MQSKGYIIQLAIRLLKLLVKDARMEYVWLLFWMGCWLGQGRFLFFVNEIKSMVI